MSQILGKISKRKQHKLIGVPMPVSFYNYMALFTIAKGTTKADILRTEMLDWKQDQMTKNPESKLINEVIKRVQGKYNRERAISPKTDVNEFLKTMESELREKGLSDDQIEKIVNRFKNGTNKSK